MNTARKNSAKKAGNVVEIKNRMSIAETRKSVELETAIQVREYAATCKMVCMAGMMYAVLNMQEQHMQDSSGRLLYHGDHGTLAVSVDHLAELGYTAETGYPCALLMGAKAPLYIDEISAAAIEAGVVVEAVADAVQTAQRIEENGNGKIGSEQAVKVFDEVVHCETQGTAAQKAAKPRKIDKTVSPAKLPVSMQNVPCVPYDADSVEGKMRITDYAMDLSHLGVPREAATLTATAVLRQMRVIA